MQSNNDHFVFLYTTFWSGSKRVFNPACSQLYWNIREDELVFYDHFKGISHLLMENPATGNVYTDQHSAVLSISAVSRNPGTSIARASWGMFYGDGSVYNTHRLVHDTNPQTTTRAEIEALSGAISKLHLHQLCDPSLRNCCVRTDSQFLMKAMTEWIYDWSMNDGLDSQGRPVEHFDALMDIHEHIDELADQRREGGPLRIRLWHIPPEWNCDAEAMANDAVNELHYSLGQATV